RNSTAYEQCLLHVFIQMSCSHHRPTLFPYTTLFRSRTPPRCRGPVGLGAKRTRTLLSIGRKNTVIFRASTYSRIFMPWSGRGDRSEEHTSELQSRENIVCRLLLEKKKKNHQITLDLT